jgi:hypothetical protein
MEAELPSIKSLWLCLRILKHSDWFLGEIGTNVRLFVPPCTGNPVRSSSETPTLGAAWRDTDYGRKIDRSSYVLGVACQYPGLISHRPWRGFRGLYQCFNFLQTTPLAS